MGFVVWFERVFLAIIASNCGTHIKNKLLGYVPVAMVIVLDVGQQFEEILDHGLRYTKFHEEFDEFLAALLLDQIKELLDLFLGNPKDFEQFCDFADDVVRHHCIFTISPLYYQRICCT